MHIVHCNTYMAMSASLVMRARVYANVCVSFNGRIAWVALACEPYSILGLVSKPRKIQGVRH